MKIYCNKKIVIAMFAVALVCLMTSVNASAQKREHITATARGTSTQLGRIISIDLRISEYSTAEDQKALLEAFKGGGTEGLANALSKMGAKGRVSITGTLGYDVNYIREFKMPDGTRRIRFVTDRPILFGEAWHSTRSRDYAISMGEINFTNGKATGVVMPAAMVKLNKEGELEIETYQNPWELVNIKVYD